MEDMDSESFDFNNPQSSFYGRQQAHRPVAYRTEMGVVGEHRRIPTGVDTDRYFEPAHTAEAGPIHMPVHSERTHDVEMVRPQHIFHSAEQLPAMAPHAFDGGHHVMEQVHYAPHEKYHAHGSRHAHADFNEHGGMLDRHLAPGLGEMMMGMHPEERDTNLLGHVSDDHHTAAVSHPHADFEQEVNMYHDSPHHYSEVHHHDVEVEDMNPNDHDLHHGPQLHEYRSHHDEDHHDVHDHHEGYEHHDEEHHHQIQRDHGHHDTELYHGHKYHHDVDHHYMDEEVEQYDVDQTVHHSFHEDHQVDHPTFTDVTYHYEDPEEEHHGDVDHHEAVHHSDVHHDYYHEPIVYHEHSHHQTQPETHHTAPHVHHHPEVYHQKTPVAEHHEEDMHRHHHIETVHTEVPVHQYHRDVHAYADDHHLEDAYHHDEHHDSYGSHHVDYSHQDTHHDTHHDDYQHHDHYSVAEPAYHHEYQMQDSLTHHEQSHLPHEHDYEGVEQHHHTEYEGLQYEPYIFRNDIYGYEDFPYSDSYFENYHYRNQKDTPPMPMAAKDPKAGPDSAAKKEEEKGKFAFPEPKDAETGKSKGCWVKVYMRGMGKKITVCTDGEELGGRSCYATCDAGFKGWGATCYKDCPEGNPDDTGKKTTSFCPKPKNEGRKSSPDPQPGYKQVGMKYFSPCKPGFKETATQCIAQCPEGTSDGGWWGCKKTTYQRTYHKAACLEDQVMSKTGLACYDVCPNNGSGFGPFCTGQCPKEFNQCFGILCLAEDQKCASIWTNLASRVQQVIDAGMKKDWGKGVLNFGQLIGDMSYSSCPTWE